MDPPAGSERIGIDWGTLKLLRDESVAEVPGKLYAGVTYSQRPILVWKGDGGEYFCHCVPFGGKDASGGPYSLWGSSVPTLLSEGYKSIPMSEIQTGDVIVWCSESGAIKHSARVESAVLEQDTVGHVIPHEDLTILNSKNGPKQAEGQFTLLDLDLQYGSHREAYRQI